MTSFLFHGNHGACSTMNCIIDDIDILQASVIICDVNWSSTVSNPWTFSERKETIMVNNAFLSIFLYHQFEILKEPYFLVKILELYHHPYWLGLIQLFTIKIFMSNGYIHCFFIGFLLAILADPVIIITTVKALSTETVLLNGWLFVLHDYADTPWLCSHICHKSYMLLWTTWQSPTSISGWLLLKCLKGFLFFFFFVSFLLVLESFVMSILWCITSMVSLFPISEIICFHDCWEQSHTLQEDYSWHEIWNLHCS